MKKLTIILLLSAGLGWTARAQAYRTYRGEVRVKQDSFVVCGDRLTLDMHIAFTGLGVSRHRTLELTPLLCSGTDTIRLQPVVILGTNKWNMYRRALALRGEKGQRKEAYAVLKNRPSYLQEITYTQSVPYREWMKNAKLLLCGRLTGYSGHPLRTTTDELTGRIVIYENGDTQ